MRTSIIIANWKMHKTVSEAIRLGTELRNKLSGKQEVEVVLAPPFTALHSLDIVIAESALKLAAQNMHYEDSGAFTGEVSPAMLTDVGCDYVILGHSERRALFGENSELVNKKVVAALEHALIPIVCVGETGEERKLGQAFEVIDSQLQAGLRGVSLQNASRIIVAYEPVWAIGTGETATPDIAQEVHAFIRSRLESIFRKDVAQQIRIVYGGSVKPDNIAELMKRPDIDGALVGGASLDSESFIKIIHYED